MIFLHLACSGGIINADRLIYRRSFVFFMKTQCPYCGRIYKVFDLFRGVSAPCVECGAVFTVEPMSVPSTEKEKEKEI